MIRPAFTLLCLCFSVLALVVPFAGCAAASGEPETELRLLVKLSVASLRAEPSAEAITGWASETAGNPVRYAAASGGGWHALLLQCSPSQCEGALQRLTEDTRHFESVERDRRKRALVP